MIMQYVSENTSLFIKMALNSQTVNENIFDTAPKLKLKACTSVTCWLI